MPIGSRLRRQLSQWAVDPWLRSRLLPCSCLIARSAIRRQWPKAGTARCNARRCSMPRHSCFNAPPVSRRTARTSSRCAAFSSASSVPRRGYCGSRAAGGGSPSGPWRYTLSRTRPRSGGRPARHGARSVTTGVLALAWACGTTIVLQPDATAAACRHASRRQQSGAALRPVQQHAARRGRQALRPTRRRGQMIRTVNRCRARTTIKVD